MTLEYPQLVHHCLKTVLIPKPVFARRHALIALVVSATPIAAFAEMPPHARPANLNTLPTIAISLGASFGQSSSQQNLAAEIRLKNRAQLVIDGTIDQAEVSGVAINGDLDTSGNGFGVGFYYQFAPVGNTFLTLAARYQDRVLEDDEAIVSGA